MYTNEEVISRVGIFVGSIEKNMTRPHNIQRVLSFNHKQFHLSAPLLMRDYLTTYETVPIVARSGSDLAYLSLASSTMQLAKEILSVAYLGTPMEPYKYIGSLESFAALEALEEEQRFGRFWLHFRGKGGTGAGRILIWQGSEVKAAESSLSVSYVREVDTSTYDLRRGVDYEPDAIFDCPVELVELLILQTARDLLTEAGNKQESLAPLANMIQDQRNLISQLDTMKTQGLSAQDLSNKDIRI